MVLAAGGPGPLLVELGLIFLALGALSQLARRAGISAVPLFLLVGLAIGEGGLVDAQEAATFFVAAAPVGVVLLLLLLGLEYGPEELVANLRRDAAAGLVDLLNLLPGIAVALLLGWGVLGALVLGGVTYISSSGIIAKALDDLGRTANRETPTVLSVLVLEDLVMAAYLPLVAGIAVGGTATRTAVTTVAAIAAAGGVLLLALRAAPRLSRTLDRLGTEGLLLTVLGATFLVAGGAEEVQVSGAVGAFLVGLAITGAAAHRVEPLLRPLRDVFGAAFFVFFAFQIDPAVLPDALLPALGLAVISAGAKVATGSWAAKRAGIGRRGRLRAGTILVTRGEFSIVIAEIGVLAEVDERLAPIAACYVLLLAVGGPLLTRFSDPIADRLPSAAT